MHCAYGLKIAMSDTVLVPELFSNLLPRLMNLLRFKSEELTSFELWSSVGFCDGSTIGLLILELKKACIAASL